jgi:(p)ppGpp synthase/HD superfamily hydrolase
MPESSTTTPMLTDRFRRAFTMASEVHAAQLRKGTSIPYLAHLMSVSALTLEHGGDEDAAIAALLHDAVEDSADGAATARQIRSDFGDHVAGIVLACSDAIGTSGQPKPPWHDRKATYLAHLAREHDPDVLLVSACDKLHNARAIITDLRTAGPALWDRFTQHDPAEHLWYYQSLATSYTSRIPTQLTDDLNRAVTEMRTLIRG